MLLVQDSNIETIHIYCVLSKSISIDWTSDELSMFFRTGADAGKNSKLSFEGDKAQMV